MTKEHLPKVARADRNGRAAEESVRYSGAERFEVDKQTWKDIDLFDQGRRGAVFALFNKVKTTGGGDALEGMLRNPSNQRAILEARRDTIRFFRDKTIDLEIGREQVARVEHYLNCYIALFPGNWLAASVYSLRNQLKQTPHYFTITNGVKSTVSLLRHLLEQVAAWQTGDCPAALAESLRGLPELITDERVRKILMDPSRPLRQMDMARCDHFFRQGGKVALRQLLDLVYQWDAYQAVALATQQYGLSFPQYSTHHEPGVKAEGLFHPLVNNAVPNDYEMGALANLCFISGANMAGKSTFLKSFGLALYLAHVGFPVPARSFETAIFNGLITTINLADSVSQGYSHFYAEVRRIKDAVLSVRDRRRVVVIFDELFRGTNVKDASDASLQVIDAFSGIEGSLFLISTHIVEIAAELQANPHIFFTAFSSTMEGGVPWYSYKLKEGVSDERAGMAILRNEGILDLLEQMRCPSR